MTNRDFQDGPSGSAISLKHLVFYLKQGREIEFRFEGKEYFISNEQKGRTVWSGKSRLCDSYSDEQIDSLLAVRLDGTSIQDIFHSLQGSIQTIF